MFDPAVANGQEVRSLGYSVSQSLNSEETIMGLLLIGACTLVFGKAVT
jgi:hypothetical protein